MSKKKNELTIKDVTASGKALVNEDQFNFLFKVTPEEQKYTRPAKGGGTWTYVKGNYVKKVLNFITGFNWDFEIIDEMVMLEIGQVVVKGKLRIRLQGEEVVKMQYGRADVKFKNEYVKQSNGTSKKTKTNIPLDLGNDLKAAATDCLKKCASEFGVAADVYGKDSFKPVRVEKKSGEDVSYEKTRERILEHIKGSKDLDELMMVAQEVDEYDLREVFDIKFQSLA